MENEPYPMPPMPEGTREGILKGIYRFRSHGKEGTDRPRVYLLGSGSILPESLKACRILEEDYGLAVDVWSVTSYKQLFYDALEKDRWVRLHPLHKPRLAYVTQQLDDGADLIVAASDYSRSLPYSLAAWLSTPMVALGTDGFGRSDSRQALRDFFEVDARHIAFAALSALVRQNKASPEVIGKALRDLDLDPEKADPLTS
ncbi:MAG: transketolase-like TK C-terminal-containing protein [Thermodesulfobacteriota bacterium]